MVQISLQRINNTYKRKVWGNYMTDIQKLKRLAFLANLPYSKHTPEMWDEELALECDLQNHPLYKSYLDQ